MLPITLFGAAWIALHVSAGRAGAHTLFQALALTECTIALLLRGRKPLGTLAASLGAWVRAHRHPVITAAAGPGEAAATA
jgi:hypothetical protein